MFSKQLHTTEPIYHLFSLSPSIYKFFQWISSTVWKTRTVLATLVAQWRPLVDFKMHFHTTYMKHDQDHVFYDKRYLFVLDLNSVIFSRIRLLKSLEKCEQPPKAESTISLLDFIKYEHIFTTRSKTWSFCRSRPKSAFVGPDLSHVSLTVVNNVKGEGEWIGNQLTRI